MKAILVIDVPDNYDLDDVYVLHEIYNYKNNHYERIEEYREDIKKVIPLPQKKEEINVNDTIQKDKFGRETIILEKSINLAVNKGYNACIDEILGEEE